MINDKIFRYIVLSIINVNVNVVINLLLKTSLKKKKMGKNLNKHEIERPEAQSDIYSFFFHISCIYLIYTTDIEMVTV